MRDLSRIRLRLAAGMYDDPRVIREAVERLYDAEFGPECKRIIREERYERTRHRYCRIAERK